MLHYSMEDGLPGNTVYEIYRDSKGMLWFATNKGVAKYNGVSFEVFTTYSGLPDNEVFFFQEDFHGRLWLATYSGELCYYKDDSFYTSRNAPFLKKQLKSSFIKQISVEKDSSITIVYNDGESFTNVKGNKCHVVYISHSFNNQKIYFDLKHVKKLSENLYKVNCWDKVMYVTEKGKILNAAADKSEQYLSYLFCQNRQHLVNRDEVYSIDGTPLKKLSGSRLLDSLGANPGRITRVFFNDSNSFIATDNGLVINDTLELFLGKKVSCVTQDRLGNYWVSTLGSGVYNFNQAFLSQRVCNHAYNEKLSYVYARNGHLFFTTATNNLYHLETGMPKCIFNYSIYKRGTFDHFFESGYLMDTNFRYYSIFNEDHLVIDNVLSARATVKRYASNFATPGVKNLFLVDNFLYLQDIKTMGRLDLLTSEVTGQLSESYRPLVDAYAPIRIFSSAQAPDKAVWYSTIYNVFRLKDGKTKPQKEFRNISFRSFNFCGNYLVGYTHGNKLLVCNLLDSTIIDMVPDQNCIWDKVYTLDSNHMLLSTNNLYRIVALYPSAGQPRYTVHAVENTFVPLYCDAICSDGNVCHFFKNGSITSVDVKSLLLRPDPPLLYFTVIKTGKASYPITDDMQMSFSNSKSISIAYATVSFSGKNVSCQYSLSKDGHEYWRNITGDINLLHPSPGDYVLKIRGKSISSDYSKPVAFMLHVARPFWATWWFMLLTVIALVALTRWAVNKLIAKSVGKKEKQHQQEVKFMKSEYKALNALMNPHFIFNTLNNVQSLFNNNDKQSANEYLRVFSDLIRQNMHNVSRELIPLQKEMELVNNYLRLEKLRFEDKMNYSIEVDNAIDLSCIMIPPLLIQPLVENSIKHGILPLEDRDGLINIHIYERDHFLYIEVRDNGVGLQPTNKEGSLHESFGLENIKKRIEQLSIIQNKKVTLEISQDDADGGPWTIFTIISGASVESYKN
jgi:two-component sensor histidine kinase